MSTLEGLVWFSLVLFMLHEFEEIILLKPWAVRNSEKIRSLWPRGKPFGLQLFDAVGYDAAPLTETASIGICIQFVLIALLTLCSVLFHYYLIWFAFMVLTPLTSLFLHLRVTIQFKGYSPGFVTAILTSVATIWVLIRVYSLMSYGVWELVIATVAVNVVLGFLAMKYMHRAATALSTRLQNYASNKKENH